MQGGNDGHQLAAVGGLIFSDFPHAGFHDPVHHFPVKAVDSHNFRGGVQFQHFQKDLVAMQGAHIPVRGDDALVDAVDQQLQFVPFLAQIANGMLQSLGKHVHHVGQFPHLVAAGGLDIFPVLPLRQLPRHDYRQGQGNQEHPQKRLKGGRHLFIKGIHGFHQHHAGRHVAFRVADGCAREGHFPPHEIEGARFGHFFAGKDTGEEVFIQAVQHQFPAVFHAIAGNNIRKIVFHIRRGGIANALLIRLEIHHRGVEKLAVGVHALLIIGDFRKGFLPLAQISCADQQALFEGIFQIPGDLNVRQNRREEYHHENQQNVAHGRLRADAFEIPFEINRLTHPSSSISKR